MNVRELARDLRCATRQAPLAQTRPLHFEATISFALPRAKQLSTFCAGEAYGENYEEMKSLANSFTASKMQSRLASELKAHVCSSFRKAVSNDKIANIFDELIFSNKLEEASILYRRVCSRGKC